MLAIQWQASGHENTLDSRIRGGRGTSKIHKIDIDKSPQEIRDRWEIAQGEKVACGARIPRDEMICGLWVSESLDQLNCKRCDKISN